MANEFHSFYLNEAETDYLSCTESKWTIISPILREILPLVRQVLERRGYKDYIFKSSLSDYSKSRELTYPVALFYLMRGLFLPPVIAAKNTDVILTPEFNDGGAPRTETWKRRFNDAVDRYYTNRFIDISMTPPKSVQMHTPPSEVLIKTYFEVMLNFPNRIDLFCVGYDDNRDFYIYGVSPLDENTTHIRVQCGAKFIMEVIRNVTPVVDSEEEIALAFLTKLQKYREEVCEETEYG